MLFLAYYKNGHSESEAYIAKYGQVMLVYEGPLS